MPGARAPLRAVPAWCALALALAGANAWGQPTPVAPAAQPTPAPAARPTVVTVRVLWPPGVDSSRIADLVTVHAGEPLSRDAVRDSIERLYATTQFSDVVVETEPRVGGVAVLFRLTAQQRVTQVTFLGNAALNRGELLRAAISALASAHGQGASASLPAGFFPEELEGLRQAVERYYARRGYESAQVTAKAESLSPTDVRVQFNIEEGAPTRIVALSVSGAPGLGADALGESLGLRLGDVLDRAALESAAKRLRERYQAERHYRAQVGAPRIEHRGAELAAVAFPVDAGPEIRFHFHGNRTFSQRELLSRLAYSQDEVLDDAEEERMASRIQRFYQLNGFFDVRVRPEETWSPDRSQLSVAFVVEEGLPLTVQEIRFVGNQHFTSKFLVERVAESLRAAVPAPPDVGNLTLAQAEAGPPQGRDDGQTGEYSVDPVTVFADDPYREALARITDLYRADGFLKTVPDLPELEIDERTRTAVVTITLVEGPQTRVRDVKLEGVPSGREILVGLSSLKVGEPYNSLEEETTRLGIVRELRHRGHLWAKVTAYERLTEGDSQIDVVYEAAPGPQVRVNRIIVNGNEETLEGIILAALALHEGDLFDPEKLAESQRNISALGVFSRVSLGPLDPDHDHDKPEKDLLVTVEERPRFEYGGSVGYSLIDGPRASAEFNRVNLLGLGIEFDSQAKLNYFNWSYPVLFAPSGPDQLQPQHDFSSFYGFGGHVNMGLRYPQVFFLQPQRVSLHADAVVERVNRPAYAYNRGALLSGLDWQISRLLVASVGFAPIEAIDVRRQKGLGEIINQLSATDVARLRFEGTSYLATLLPSLTLDLRDNAANPHSGLLLSGNAELAHSVLDPLFPNSPHAFYVKPSATVNFYVPLGSRATVAISSRAGRVLPLDSTSQTIPPKRFFLGGATTLRGYPEDGLTPEDTRSDLYSQVSNCRALPNPVGCTEAAQVIDTGNLLPSEGGLAFVLGKAELRIALFGDVEGVVFVDAGNLWLDPAKMTLSPSQMRLTPGLGIHVGTPVGPVAIDTGFNPLPDTLLNETFWDPRYVHFSIGVF